MKFVVSMGIRKLPGSPQPMHEIYRDFLEEAVLAEELGFDAVWASEHHFSPDAWSPSPVPFLAAVAALTQRIRIGTYVLLLPLYNPVRSPRTLRYSTTFQAGASICRSGSGRRSRNSTVSGSYSASVSAACSKG